jgi:hypothetical protein
MFTPGTNAGHSPLGAGSGAGVSPPSGGLLPQRKSNGSVGSIGPPLVSGSDVSSPGPLLDVPAFADVSDAEADAASDESDAGLVVADVPVVIELVEPELPSDAPASDSEAHPDSATNAVNPPTIQDFCTVSRIMPVSGEVR